MDLDNHRLTDEALINYGRTATQVMARFSNDQGP